MIASAACSLTRRTLLSASKQQQQQQRQNLHGPSCRLASRWLSTTTTTPTSKGGGFSGLLGRIASFLIGAGLSALGTQYYIYQELHEGNKLMIMKQLDLEKRVTKLEK